MAVVGARTIVCCDAAGLPADARTIEALARLQLCARRQGLELRLREPSPELQRLIDLCGLAEVLRVEPRREPE